MNSLCAESCLFTQSFTITIFVALLSIIYIYIYIGTLFGKKRKKKIKTGKKIREKGKFASILQLLNTSVTYTTVFLYLKDSNQLITTEALFSIIRKK
jgi:hypothetical protein